MRKKRSGLYPVAAALVILGLAGCGTRDAMQKEIELLTPVEAVVDIETVMYRDLYTMTTRDAELAPYNEELSFEAGGRISKLYVELGSEVKAGDLLAEQEEEGVVNNAGNALNKYLSEKKVYMDTVKAAKRKLAANPGKEEKEWQELLIAQAEELWVMQEPQLWAAWEEARSKVGKSQIFAPCDGVITACLSEGTTVSAGQPVLALADTNRLYVTVGSYLSPADYSNYEEIYAIVNGKETEVTYIEELMEEEGLYTYYSAADYNGARMGDYVLVCMKSNYHDHVLSIPSKAIYRDSSGSYVYLLDGDIRVRRDVVTGYSSDVYVEILEGLQEGDRVYVKN
ncbi:MAG: efflux RND transporter periplasmic adaptor subunit [Lachnospiraceae bacterium]|nr:efflux RND transporter periplasmic adaptor subunit [Lachnospiraceae bacterium]MBQ8547185.1 efflux RND transporter periplasmic adaptor subunit [Lachnospiraceae bacterium]MBQ8845561.1 efflux RND transporter periplasmic adaptor subunit [Lachnospiraceae bacterium]